MGTLAAVSRGRLVGGGETAADSSSRRCRMSTGHSASNGGGVLEGGGLRGRLFSAVSTAARTRLEMPRELARLDTASSLLA